MPDVLSKRIAVELAEYGRVHVPYWEVSASSDGPVLLVTAAQHGNEVQGSEALRRFVMLAAEKLDAGQVRGVPFCNLPALWQRRHHDHQGPEEPVSEQAERNMNLVWPGDPAGNDTARLAHAIYSELGTTATHAVDIHCWTRFWAAACFARSDRPRCQELAAISALPFARVTGGPGAGSPPAAPTLIGAYFNDTDRAALTFELSGQYVIDETQVHLGARCLANVARFLEMMPGGPEGTDEGPTWRDGGKVVEVAAPRKGLFVEARLGPGDWVTEGQPLGHLLCDDDLSTPQLTAPAAGRLEAFGCHRRHCDVSLPDMHPYAVEGDVLARIIVPAAQG